jgi:hypothetical protein
MHIQRRYERKYCTFLHNIALRSANTGISERKYIEVIDRA